MNRERELTEAFVELADSLVSDFDVAELLHTLVEHCVHLLDTAAAGILLSDQRGHLQVLASSTEQARLLELFQLQAAQGPSLDCFRTGEPVAVADMAAETHRWPEFAPALLAEGYVAVHAVPLRLREETIGVLNLFCAGTGDLSVANWRVARALADVATISILQERQISRNETLVEQLQGALNSRIIIEQAKGVLAEAGQVEMDEAFRRLRAYARDTNTRLARLARDVVDGQVVLEAVLCSDPQYS